MVDLKGREDWHKFITARNGIKLSLIQVWHKVDHECSLDFNQHELVDEVFTKVGEVHEGPSNLGEITNCYGTVDAQIVGFKENLLLLEPGKEIAIWAVEFDIAKALVAQHMAANAYLCLVFLFNSSCQNLEVSFEFGFSFQHCSQHKDNLIIVAGCSED